MISKFIKMFSFLIIIFSLLTSKSNAIEVRFEKDPSVPIVDLNIAIKGGGAYDPKGKSGLSNFTGEMLLRGSKKYSKEQFDLLLDQIGASIGVETKSEMIVIRGSVLSSKLDTFLSLLESLLEEPSFQESEISKLKKEVVSQILEEKSRDQSLAKQKWEEFFYKGHPYGNPILGHLSEVEKISLADIQSFYKNHFQDQNLLIVGTGDADEEKIKKWGQSLSEKLKNTSEGHFLPLSPPVASHKRRIAILDKPDRTQTQIFIGQNGILMNDENYFPFNLANQVFGGGSFSARLMVEIRVKRGWSYGANSYQRHGTQPKTWQAYTFPANKDTPDAVVKMIEMIQDWKEKGITREEYEFTQKSLVNSAGFMFNTPKKRVENILLENTLHLPTGFFKTYGPETSKVTLDQANKSIKSVIHPEELSIFILGTAKELKPKLAAALKVKESEIEVISYNKD